MCLKFPGARTFIGRSVLANLKKSTLLTLFDIFKSYGFQNNIDYRYNQQDNYIQLSNGSDIYLLDLDYYPSDPNYDRIGSTEFTCGFIDEANQITYQCFEVLKARMRYKLKDFGLKGIIFMSCNPAKNWVYSEFYKPWKEQKLEMHRDFIQALAIDNPNNPPDYIDSLKNIKDKILKARLFYGNWEYEDDSNALFHIDPINDMFTNTVPDAQDKYIVCDAARLGRDRAVIGVWNGLKCISIQEYGKTKTTELESLIRENMTKYSVPLSHVIVDEDGVGGGIVDHLGCKGFVGGSAPIQDEQKKINTEAQNDTYIVNYQNLRAQCYYMLADYVDKHMIYVTGDNMAIRQHIVEELEQIKAKNVDNDKKLAIIPKEDIKEMLGRSPDFADMLMMRMYFELRPQKTLTIRFV